MAFGVAVSIRSGLGTTPISSVPYVYNLVFPSLSVGWFTVVLNVFFVLLQVIILRKMTVAQALQIPIVVLFGWFIDLQLGWTAGWVPANYLWQWAYCLFGCVIMAFGNFLHIKADVSLLPGEGLIMAVAGRLEKDFGTMKIVFDSLLVLIALASVWLLMGQLQGVREGTLASAILVGLILQCFNKYLSVIDRIITPDAPALADFVKEPYMTTQNFVITIARQYGSGGHAVGEQVAKRLGVAFYDSSLIDLTAEAGGFTPEYVKAHEQKLSNTMLYTLYKQNYAYVNEVMPPQDSLFMVQTKVIRDIAARESCVIVGRCADYILKGHPNCFRVFVHASDAFRKSRVIAEYGIHPDEAEKEMEKKDRERMNYNAHYTRRNWADLKDYDLTIESSLFGIDITAAMIIDARRKALYTSGA